MTLLQRMKRDKKYRFKVILVVFVVLAFVTSIEKKEAVTEQGCNEIFEPSYGVDADCMAGCLLTHYLDFVYCIQECVTDDSVYEFEFEECIDTPGCYVQSTSAGTYSLPTDCISLAWKQQGYVEKCTMAVPNGKYVYDTKRGCASDYGRKVGKICGHDIYECKDPPDPDYKETTCNSGQEAIANLIYDVFDMDEDDLGCKTAYYLVLGAGAMILFLGIGLVL